VISKQLAVWGEDKYTKNAPVYIILLKAGAR
jgi:hypothetical protein